MEREEIEDVRKYMETIGINDHEDWFCDTTDYEIKDNTLVTGLDFCLDDKTGTHFKTLGEIVEFYKLPMLPDNVRTKEELAQYKKHIGL